MHEEHFKSSLQKFRLMLTVKVQDIARLFKLYSFFPVGDNPFISTDNNDSQEPPTQRKRSARAQDQDIRF